MHSSADFGSLGNNAPFIEVFLDRSSARAARKAFLRTSADRPGLCAETGAAEEGTRQWQQIRQHPYGRRRKVEQRCDSFCKEDWPLIKSRRSRWTLLAFGSHFGGGRTTHFVSW